jgi:hypothetical protein
MQFKTPVAATLLAAAALAAGCGGGSSEPDIAAADARAAVEQAAGVKLSAMELVKDGPEHGLLGSYGNLDRAATDRQLVMLLMLDDAGKASEIRDQITGGLPAGTETIEHENALVFYGAHGRDRSAAIEQALEGLS